MVPNQTQHKQDCTRQKRATYLHTRDIRHLRDKLGATDAETHKYVRCIVYLFEGETPRARCSTNLWLPQGSPVSSRDSMGFDLKH